VEQEGVGSSGNRPRRHRECLRRQLEPLLGGAVRETVRGNERFVGEALRNQPHRKLQGSRHDGARQPGQPSTQDEPTGDRRGMRLHRRHLGRALGVLRVGGNPLHRVPTGEQDLDRAANPAGFERRSGAEH